MENQSKNTQQTQEAYNKWASALADIGLRESQIVQLKSEVEKIHASIPSLRGAYDRACEEQPKADVNE